MPDEKCINAGNIVLTLKKIFHKRHGVFFSSKNVSCTMLYLENQHPNIQSFPGLIRTEVIKVSHSYHFSLMFMQNHFQVIFLTTPKFFGQAHLNFHWLHVNFGTVGQICIFCSLVSSHQKMDDLNRCMFQVQSISQCFSLVLVNSSIHL